MKNALRRIFALGLAACLALALAACGGGGGDSGGSGTGGTLARNAGDYVIDEAGVLSDDTKAVVFNISQALQERCGAQIGVYTVEYIGNTTMEAFAYQVGNDWQLGDADKDNGILLLLAVGDDDYFVMRGSGLESQLTVPTLDSLLYQNMEPSWVERDYDTGTCKTVLALAQQLCRIYGLTMDLEAIAYGTGSAASTEASNNSGGSGGGSFLTVLLVLLAIVLVIWLIGTLSRRKRRGPPPPPPAGYGGYSPGAYPNTYSTRRRSSFGSGFASGVGFGIGQNVGRRIFGGSRRPPSPPPPPPPSGGRSAPPSPRSGFGGGVHRSGGSFRAGGGSFRGGGAGRRK